jgi:uncharacterized protein YecE (DUF72 family)
VTLLVGTSGWQYADWRGSFYPAEVPVSHWLEHYARSFPTVEVNATFYRLPESATFERWRRATPEGFIFAPKVSRYLTHVRRLREPAEAVSRFLDRSGALEDRLGPVLLQLPPTMTADVGLLAATLACFPRNTQVAVEPRHPSWFGPELRRLLEGREAALCLADRAEEPVTPLWRTAPWLYLRLHEGCGSPRPGYRTRTLEQWVERLRSEWGADANGYVYFNNDAHGCAPRDARRFEEAAAGVIAVRSQIPPEK